MPQVLGAALALGGVVGLATAADRVLPSRAQCAARGGNKPLAQRHRVILAQWPALEDPGNGLTDAESLFRWCVEKGYDGLEVSADDMRKRFWPSQSLDWVARETRALCDKYDLEATGSLYHVTDGISDEMGKRVHHDGSRFDLDLNDADFWPALREKVQRDRRLGNQYINFHIRLPLNYLHTGGEYRDDHDYIRRTAQRMARIQKICFEEDLNCYFETHMNMIGEDPSGFVKILDACPEYVETNCDISHYIFREILQGRSLQRITSQAGHTHQRMARRLGDLSAKPMEDFGEDWDQKGVTWQAFESSKPVLRGGLSSRCIVGETGPIHALAGAPPAEGALALDAALVPLWRKMAEYADAQAGVSPSPGSARPAMAAGRGRSQAPSSVDEEEAERVLREHFSAGQRRN